MATWTDNMISERRVDRSRSPRRDSVYSGDNNRGWDYHGRDRAQGWDRDRRGRSRSPGYEDGRKRRRSMSPYDRERYESRPRYDDHDSYRGGHDRSPPRSRDHRHGGGPRSYRQAPPDPHTFDAPATLKQYADWFRYYYPQQAVEEDQADKLAEQEAGDGTRPRNGIKSRWERYKKDFLQKQMQILFDYHQKSPWFVEKYDPAMTDLRSRVRKVGWRGRINQFVLDLENGAYDTPNVEEPELPEASVENALGASDVADISLRNEDDLGMGPDEDDRGAGAAVSKADANGTHSEETKNEVSVMPEGNQIMIRTIPPDIGRVKLESILRSMSGFVYLALGDPMQKRNYYRAGWIKFDSTADVQSHLAVLGERKIEGFKLQVTHNSEPFISKVRYTPEAASKPDRVAKDLINARRLAMILEEEYENVRTFRRSQPSDDSGEADTAPEQEKKDNSLSSDVISADAAAEDEPLTELGSQAIEKKLSDFALENPVPDDEEAAKLLENRKDAMALDLYVAYLRAAFHTCYYCAAVCDHQEELQRKCIKHVRRPLKAVSLESGSKTKEAEVVNPETEVQADDSEKKHGQGTKARAKERDMKKSISNSDERWAENFDAKIILLVNKEAADPRDYGGKRYEDLLAEAVKPYVKQEDEGKFRCSKCQKLFKAMSFVEKHIANKHPEVVQHLDELPYFNNFALDPQRIQPLNHYPQQTSSSQPVPPQAYGLQNIPQPIIDPTRNVVGMNLGMGMGMGVGLPGGIPIAYYPIPTQLSNLGNGGEAYLAYYQQALAQGAPMREPSSAANGRKLGDRIGGFVPGADASGLQSSHGIVGLPAKPVGSFDIALTANSGSTAGRRGGGSRAMPPPPPDAKEDPRAASGRRVSYHDMDLVAEGDVELTY